MTPAEESWLALCLVDRVGGKTLGALLDAFGDADAVLAADADAIRTRCGLKPALAERVARARDVPAFQIERRLVAEHGVRLITLRDAEYPQRLGDVYLPPPLLYVKGAWPPPGGPWLSIVGTRGHTRYGEKLTREIVGHLAAAAPEAVIVSGLARGIDTIAHEQAVACGLFTIGVLGGGLTAVYPPENGPLAERMQQRGALITEFAMTARPLARNFPIRNRVIAGLGDGVLVVEAGERSGALITASFALNYGRRVLALPGNADQAASSGTNALIRSGQATLVTSGPQVLAALQGTPASTAPRARVPTAAEAAPAAHPRAPATPAPGGAERPKRARKPPADSEKGRLLACLERGPLHPDDLAGETGLPIERLIGLLLELELSGEIYQTAEHQFALA